MVFMIGIDLIYYNIISVFFPLAFIGGSVPLFYVSILLLNFIFNKRLFGLNSVTAKRERLCQFAIYKTLHKNMFCFCTVL